MKSRLFLFVPLFLLLLGACRKEYPLYSGPGKKPVYISDAELNDVKNLPPQPIENTGVIFLKDPLLFMVEQFKGIHVIELSDTTNPVNLTFFNIPAVTDFSISGNTLYADNGPNLISIDITNIYQIQVLGISPGVFQPVLYPTLYNGFFECADPAKGNIVGWEDTELENAACNTTN